MGLLLIDAVYSSSLPRGERDTAVVFARKAEDAGGMNCYPGAEIVARCRGVEPPIVRRHRRALIERGVLLAEEVRRHGRRQVKTFGFDAWHLPDVDVEILKKLEAAVWRANKRQRLLGGPLLPVRPGIGGFYCCGTAVPQDGSHGTAVPRYHGSHGTGVAGRGTAVLRTSNSTSKDTVTSIQATTSAAKPVEVSDDPDSDECPFDLHLHFSALDPVVDARRDRSN